MIGTAENMKRILAIVAGVASICLFTLSTRASAQKILEEIPAVNDNSDWWSIIRNNSNDSEDLKIEPQKIATAPSNFLIAGIRVGEDELSTIATKLGKTDELSRGDAATGRSQICYVSIESRAHVYLVFESGEVQYAAYLFQGGPKWSGENSCAQSVAVKPSLKTESGLRLGLTPAQVEGLLGKPTLTKPDKLVYFRSVKKRNSPEALRKLREENPKESEKQFHENYDFYDQTVYIEIRFAEGKVRYLGLSMSETM